MHLRSISLLLRLVSDLRPTPSYYAPYTLNKSQNNVVLLSFKLEGGLKAGISTGVKSVEEKTQRIKHREKKWEFLIYLINAFACPESGEECGTTHLITHSLTHSLTHLLTHSCVHSLIRSRTC